MYLTRQSFIKAVRQALESAGVDQLHYCGQVFELGLLPLRQQGGGGFCDKNPWKVEQYSIPSVHEDSKRSTIVLFQNTRSAGSVRRCR